jgi:hypothetical protein
MILKLAGAQAKTTILEVRVGVLEHASSVSVAVATLI